jgi:hypothetical protein
VRYIIATAANIDPSERPQLLEFSEALHEGLENISRLAATFEDAAKSTATLGDAARPLRKGATRLARGFQRAAAASSTFAVWDTLLREAIAQLPS